MADPRPRRASAGVIVSLVLGGAFTGVFVLLGGLFTAIGGPVWDDWILDARGVPATAIATDFPSPERTARPGSYLTRWFRVEVEVAPGTPTTLWADEAAVAAAQRGEALAIEIDPSDPGRARLAGKKASFFGGFVAIPAAFGVAGVPLLGLGALLGLRRAGFVRNAVVVRAEVLEVRVFGGEGSTARVDLSYPGPGGEPMRGSCLYNGKAKAGDAMWVAYDRRAPSRCEILGP